MTKFNKVVILTQSVETIKSTHPENNIVREIHTAVKMVQGLHKEIMIQWMPAHCQIIGNEVTAFATGNEVDDFLAKRG